MRAAYKYRLYPNQAQARFLENQLHEACELYNAALQNGAMLGKFAARASTTTTRLSS